MIKKEKKFRAAGWLMTAAAMLLCVGVTISDAYGQGTRRKRKANSTATAPAPMPVVPAGSGDAQIISRASDYGDENVQLVPAEQKRPELPTYDANETTKALDDIRNRITAMESVKKGDPDEKQKRLLLNLDILNRAEQRSESLRKQLFELMEKESGIRAKLDMIDVNMRPEMIEREVAFAGTLRPEDLRTLKRKQFEVEKASLTNILNEIQKTRTVLEQNLQRSDDMVEKLRVKLDKEVDSALTDSPSN